MEKTNTESVVASALSILKKKYAVVGELRGITGVLNLVWSLKKASKRMGNNI